MGGIDCMGCAIADAVADKARTKHQSCIPVSIRRGRKTHAGATHAGAVGSCAAGNAAAGARAAVGDVWQLTKHKRCCRVPAQDELWRSGALSLTHAEAAYHLYIPGVIANRVEKRINVQLGESRVAVLHRQVQVPERHVEVTP